MKPTRDDFSDDDWGTGTFVGRLSDAERHALLAMGVPAAHATGEHLLVEGDRSRFVLVLHGGPVKVVVHDTAGREHLLGLRRRGDLLGELAYLDNQPRSASVVTLSPMRVTRICGDRFGHFLDKHPRVGLELARSVASRLRDADRSCLEISSADVAVRVGRLLRDLVLDPASTATPRRAVIPLTQQQLAQLAHAAEVTVHRVLREFRRHGLVLTSYGSIEVPCLVCLDRFLTVRQTWQAQDGQLVRGCGGRESHAHQRRPTSRD